jgi:hypothetical protein
MDILMVDFAAFPEKFISTLKKKRPSVVEGRLILCINHS